jgi:hypothetical protein
MYNGCKIKIYNNKGIYMKRALIIGLICVANNSAYAKTNAELIQEISTSHYEAFSNRGTMYEAQLNAKHIEKWSEAMAHTRDFVEENASKNKEKLLNCVSDIEKDNNDMINIIKAAYGTIKGTGLELQKRSKEIDALSKKYQGIANKMEEIKKRANSIEKTTKTDSEKKAAQMVYVLANFVGETALSAKTDLY